MKKGLALLLVMVLAMTMLLVACNQDSWVKATPSKGLKFESNGDGTCAVVGIGECTDTDVVIPKKSPDGDRVTSIAKMAFSLCTDMTSLTLLGSVTSIGDGAFYGCTGLTSITISDSVTSIGINAFSMCTGLTSVTLPDSVTNIAHNAFSECTGLNSITVSKRNTTYHSAENCIIETQSKTLVMGCQTSVIPADGSVTSIGEVAFSGCTGLTSITIPDSVTSIGKGAFYGCTGLTSITISDSVTSIGDSAFSDCTGLTDIMIPDSITSIGMYAFTGCTGLTSVTIGNGVASIEEGAFWACTSLTDVYYTGSESEWAAIEIGFEFGGLETVGLETATIHYNYVPEE